VGVAAAGIEVGVAAVVGVGDSVGLGMGVVVGVGVNVAVGRRRVAVALAVVVCVGVLEAGMGVEVSAVNGVGDICWAICDVDVSESPGLQAVRHNREMNQTKRFTWRIGSAAPLFSGVGCLYHCFRQSGILTLYTLVLEMPE